MQSITVRNVNEALPLALALLRDTGKPVAPRGMQTLEIEGPFATTYTCPWEMVLFDPVRDANPFFHFFEALWILQGRRDVEFLAHFLPRMADFSDDGQTFHAPYGHRLRNAFQVDQIEEAIDKLRSDRDSRQAVLSIWNPNADWARTKDVPCNDMLMFKVRDGRLRMTVCNRSNDAVLGAYGANVVQFSTLLCYMAARIGVDVGAYTQVSDSFHVYLDNPYWIKFLETHPAGVATAVDPYADGTLEGSVAEGDGFVKSLPAPVDVAEGLFDVDLGDFFRFWDSAKARGRASNPAWFRSWSFRYTVAPMLQTFNHWKAGERDAALVSSLRIEANDWRLAAQAWMQRRIDKAAK